MKIISDPDTMKALKNVNKKLLDVVWLSSYDDNQIFSRKLISCKFSNSAVILKYAFG